MSEEDLRFEEIEFESTTGVSLVLDNEEEFDGIDVPDVLSLMDVSLVPLKKSDLFKTVIPSKIFENAAMQTPILLGVEGESANIINEYGAGLCFEPENKTSFIKNLTILKENKDVYFSCQNGCLNLAKAFDRRKMADEMRKYILEIL